MTDLQSTLIFVYGLANFILFIRGFHETKNKKNAYGLTPWLLPVGMFAWADSISIGIFWTLTSFIALFRDDWILFLLIVSLFWAVRAFGEMTYWFHQQFSSKNLNPIEKIPWHSIFHDDSVWFFVQTIWQCILVTTLITSVYLAHLWLRGK
ncbi:MAG TPA: hypothetical protein VLH19_02360 [Patescibacteria group bacterium]|nr:hypothetical protein [Patescibacteria group bacterium]